MESKPELIVFSQNLMGGGSSFHRNMMDNWTEDYFDVKCIYLDPLHWNAKRLDNINLGSNDLIFEFNDETNLDIAKRLSNHISNREGVVIANLPEELIALDYFPKSNKTIYFICHDNGFLYLVEKYDYLIDVFIAHNFEVYQDILKLLPNRKNDIHFIQHGVKVQNFQRKPNVQENLNLVFLARHVKKKGIYDLPKIDDDLRQHNISVNWTILGDGEERENFINQVKDKSNFTFSVPKTSEEIIEILKNQDIYILPSSLDGLPVSLLESMSVGVVPIVYNFSEGIRKVITNEIGFVEKSHDYLGIASQIRKLNDDRDLLNTLSNNCSKKIQEEFNITVQANLYYSLYKKYKELKKQKKFSLKKWQNRFGYNSFLGYSIRGLQFLNKKMNALTK